MSPYRWTRDIHLTFPFQFHTSSNLMVDFSRHLDRSGLMQFRPADQRWAGLSGATTLVAATGNVHPRHRYKAAWDAIDVWRRRRLLTQVPPMPHYLAPGCANILVLLGLVYEGAAMFITCAGLVRIGEALAFHWSNSFRIANCWVLILGTTKPSSNQTVVITGSDGVKWFDSFFALARLQTADKPFPITYAKLAKTKRWITDRLGHG